MLERDLLFFRAGLPTPAHLPILPPLEHPAAFLGAMYVMEGSTLGGQLIARSLQQSLGLTPGSGDAYFRGHEQRTGPLWKGFCDLLQTRIPDHETDTVVRGARAMFQTFGTWMQST